MQETQRIYLPAAGHDWLLPLYDPLTKLLGSESAHRELLRQAGIQPHQRVLEIGCGTGNLTILVKRLYPGAEVIGFDPDAKALSRARRKAERQGLSIRFDRGFSEALQYPDSSFDRVLSAFMFHHLPNADAKMKTLLEVRRILVPGGSLHLIDFGGGTAHGRFLVHLLHRTERFQDNAAERILTLMREAGFADPVEVAHRRIMIFGRVTRYRASSPPAT
jgi:ubiquinone/menaquinone biosynthesis C-methylase UbiE